MVSYTFVRNSDGNLNVPYLIENDDKVVLNWNWLDNDFNDNYLSPSVRNLLYFSPAFLSGEFCLISDPFQPPSIRPISLIFSDNSRYFLSSSDLLSQIIISRIFKVSFF